MFRHLFKNIISFSLFFILLLLFGCQNTPSSTSTNSNLGTVPIYQGMEIVSNELLSYHEPPMLSNMAYVINDPTNPFNRPIGSRIEDLIANVLPINSTNPSADYFASLNEEVILRIRIENPDSYEILSFTLNATKYQSYQFQEGSDSENLYLKTSVGSHPGVIQFTIDQIKYIEGTEIKDVVMGGNQTISVGIQYPNFPAINVTSTLHTQSSFTIQFNQNDPQDILNLESSALKAFLFDGEALVQQIDITHDMTSVTFSSLNSNTLYQYAIAGVIDDLDSQGQRRYYWTVNYFFTTSYLQVDLKNISESSIQLEIINLDLESIGEITAVEIYLAETLVTSKPNQATLITFSELLSNQTYTVKIAYSYILTGEETLRTEWTYINVKTKAYSTPTVSITDLSSTQTSIHFNLDLIDPNALGTIEPISLYQGETLVFTLPDTAFVEWNDLTQNTLYTIKVAYAYNLFDGLGVKNVVFTQHFPTLNQAIEVTSVAILNTTNPKAGEEIFVRINLTNPAAITITQLAINDFVLPVTGGDGKTSLIVSFVPEIDGGNYTIKVNSLSYVSFTYLITQTISSSLTDEIMIMGNIDVLSFDSENNHIINTNAWSKLYITIHNPTNYTIYKLVITYYDYFGGASDYTYNFADITQIDASSLSVLWYGNSYMPNYPTQYVSIKSIHYGLEETNQSTTYFTLPATKFFLVNSSEPILISTPAELQNISGGYIYQLANSINMASYSWTPMNFSGVLDGHGFEIQNVTILFSNEFTTVQMVGFFKELTGLVMNVSFTNLYLSVHTNGQTHMGGVAGYCSGCTIENVSVTGDFSYNSTAATDSIRMGSLVGTGYGIFIGNHIHTNMTLVSNHDGRLGGIGGFISGDVSSNDVIIYMNIKSSGISAGGIAGYVLATKINDNVIDITFLIEAVNSTIGGIIGSLDYSVSITNNQVIGSIDISSKANESYVLVGGVAGAGGATITHNLIDTDISVSGTYVHIGGILGSGNSYSNIEGNGVYGALDVIIPSNGAYANIGGLVGSFSGLMTHNITDQIITIQASGAIRFGGLVGQSYDNASLVGNEIKGTINIELLHLTKNSYLGGMIGQGDKNLISNNSLLASISITSHTSDTIGGIAGLVENNSQVLSNLLINTFEYTSDSSQNSANAGNLVGKAMESTVKNNIIFVTYHYQLTLSSFTGNFVGDFPLSTILNNKIAYTAKFFINQNAYAYDAGCIASLTELNSNDYYTDILEFESELWTYSDLDFEVSQYPYLILDEVPVLE